jgi:hypothetical protein
MLEKFSALLGGQPSAAAGRDSVQIRKRIFLEKSSDFVQNTEQFCYSICYREESLFGDFFVKILKWKE